MDNSKGSVIGVVAVAIAIAALIFSVTHRGTEVTPPAPADQAVGGERAGLQEFVDGVKAGQLVSKWITAPLPPLTNQVKLYCNTSGRDVFADYGSAIIISSDTASSTSKIHLFATTTSSSIPTTEDFATIAEGKGALLSNVQIATSSTATTTSSVYAAAAKLGNGAVMVPNNSCIWGYLQQDTTAASSLCSSNGKCETATSTNRGFNPVFNVRLETINSNATSL